MKKLSLEVKDPGIRFSYEPNLDGQMTFFVDLYGNSTCAWNSKNQIKRLRENLKKTVQLIDRIL